MDNKSRQTRLSRRTLRESKKKLLYSLAGIIIVLFLLFKFGIPALIKFALFISGTKSSQDTSQTSDQPSFVAPPSFNEPYTATNSAPIKVSGTAVAKQSIILYVNDQQTSTTNTKDDGSFTFNNVTLNTGDNTLKIKAQQGNKESDFSDPWTVTYANTAPSLTITSPTDGQSFSKDPALVVQGKTDPNDTVTVNGFQAIVDTNGNFSYNLQMQNGDNRLKIIATDQAGNKTEKDIKVTYNP